jgi:LacI family transcriptional regulator
MKSKKATIKDVANMANVSITTVSLVLNNKTDSISPETIEKVKACVKECNYFPNPSAASLITKKTKTIGYIIPDIKNMFFNELAKNIEMEIVNKGYNLILCNSDDKFDRDVNSIISLVNRNIDLLVISPSLESLKSNNADRLYSLLSNLEIPYIIVDRVLPNKECNSIVNDHEYGGYIATKHLIENGHKNIACLTGPFEDTGAKGRYNGYIKALKEANIEINPSYLFCGDYTYESGYHLAQDIIKNKDITAVFACNGLMAFGVYQVCCEHNISVPNDISLVGFDDMFYSRILEIPLTSVRLNTDLMSKLICNYIYNVSKDKNEPVKCNEVVIPKLSIKSSVKNISK